MFGFGDMAMGVGMMDMTEGVILTQMGMPGLGAMEMGMGAMQMGMGMGMMGYGGYGYGGYGMGGMGLVAAQTALVMGCMGVGCTRGCCRPGLFGGQCMGIGCSLPCCIPRRRFFGNCTGIGCTGPCCTQTTIVIQTNPQFQGQNYQYQYQNYQNQPVYNQPQQQYNQNANYQAQQSYKQNYQQNIPQQNYQPNNSQQQGYFQQNYQQNQQNQQNYQNQQNQNLPQQQPQKPYQTPQQNYQQFQQAPQSNQIPYGKPILPAQLVKQTSFKQSQKQSQVAVNQSEIGQFRINESFAIGDDTTAQQNKDQIISCSARSNQINAYQYGNTQNQYNSQNATDIVYQGVLFKRIGFNWTQYPNATLTSQYLLSDSLPRLTKIKIKMDITHQDTCFLKITLNQTQDHFYGCYKGQQLDWFCSIIWAKMCLQNKNSNRFSQFTGYIQGNIMRKSQILGNWQFRHVKIDPSGLKSYRNVNMAPTLTLPNIRELWCRFDYVGGSNYLVIKCKWNGIKYQYGVPLNCAFSWLKAFYSLMM